MLKIVSAPSHARRRGRRQPREVHNSVRALHQAAESGRAVVNCTQRTVARARSAIIDAQCRVLCFQDRLASRNVLADENGARAVAELTGRLADIHARLLVLSTNVEMEVDRLELTQAEIDLLTAPGQYGDRS